MLKTWFQTQSEWEPTGSPPLHSSLSFHFDLAESKTWRQTIKLQQQSSTQSVQPVNDRRSQRAPSQGRRARPERLFLNAQLWCIRVSVNLQIDSSQPASILGIVQFPELCFGSAGYFFHRRKHRSFRRNLTNKRLLMTSCRVATTTLYSLYLPGLPRETSLW